MLTAAQIEALRSHSEQLLDPLTDFLIEDIAKRVSKAGQFTATASYDAWKLQQLGVSQRKLKQEIAKRLGVSIKDAEKLLTQAAKTGYNFDMSRFPTSHAIPLSANSSLQQILQATVEMAKDDLTNITQTIGFVGPDGQCRELTDAYNQACDFAFQKVSTGAQDYQSAIREATRNLAEKGIRTIDYESGVHTSIEAAVRRNIMGGLGIMQEKISESNHDAIGCDGWEISAHGCCAPDHEPIQGKQFDDKTYKRINESLLRRIGTLNCGHAAFPIILGVNEPVYSEEELEEFRRQNEEGVTFEGKHYTLYEATQRQRKFERTIRKQKRRILVDEATEDAEKLQIDQIKLQRLKQEYARFSKGVGLPVEHARMETAGFGYKQASTAAKASKIAGTQKETLAKRKNSDIMKIESGGRRNEVPLTEAQIKECVAYAEHLGMPSDRIRYGEHYFTSYGSNFDMLYVGTDAYPSPNGKTANQKLTYRCALAHEIIGHREAVASGTSLKGVDSVLDEVQASIRAARFANGLSQSERIMLLRDAIERLKGSGRKIRDVKHLLHIETR